MTKRTTIITTIVLIGIVGVSVSMFAKRRHGFKQMQSEDLAFKRAHSMILPQRDFCDWNVEFGKGEPNPATSEGREVMEGERIRLPAAQEEFRKLIGNMPEMCASEIRYPEISFMKDVHDVLDSFSRESCAKILSTIRWGRCGKSLEASLMKLDTEHKVIAVERYYHLSCQLADLLWRRCGLEFEAAEADYRIYVSLENRKRFAQQKGWHDVVAVIDRCREDWQTNRCDSERSNFCRSHLYWENRYRMYYEERVKRGETHWLKVLSGYYRFNLELARDILNREPKWSPIRQGSK